MNKSYILENGLKVKVCEVKHQKEILQVLDAKLRSLEFYTTEMVFKRHTFKILYKDGTQYVVNQYFATGVYRKKGIVAILHQTIDGNYVYGDYEINAEGQVDILTPNKFR